MSCDYCTSVKSMMRDSYSDVRIRKADGVYRIYYSDGPHWRTTEPIRFCPMCGERFAEVVKDSFESIKQDMTLDVCTYAKKRGIVAGDFECKSCKWDSYICTKAMREDIADRLGKLLDEENER
mgnify:CR=1 FL=1